MENMLDRAQIERLLKLNGVTPLSNDEEIRSALLSSRWDKDDVEAALMVLRENKETHETRIDTLHQIMRSDDKLSPDTISALLGIDMKVEKEQLEKHQPQTARNGTIGVIGVIVFALFSATLLFFTVMWKMQIGMFHPGL